VTPEKPSAQASAGRRTPAPEGDRAASRRARPTRAGHAATRAWRGQVAGAPPAHRATIDSELRPRLGGRRGVQSTLALPCACLIAFQRVASRITSSCSRPPLATGRMPAARSELSMKCQRSARRPGEHESPGRNRRPGRIGCREPRRDRVGIHELGDAEHVPQKARRDRRLARTIRARDGDDERWSLSLHRADPVGARPDAEGLRLPVFLGGSRCCVAKVWKVRQPSTSGADSWPPRPAAGAWTGPDSRPREAPP